MALKSLVTDRFSQNVFDFVRSIEVEKGPFLLAMLVPAAPSGRWNLVLSALWMDDVGTADSVRFVGSKMKLNLSPADASKLFRISVLPTSDSLVRGLQHEGIKVDAPSRIHNSFELFSREIEDPIVLVA